MEIIIGLLVLGALVYWYFTRSPLDKNVKETLVTPQKDEVPYKVETPESAPVAVVEAPVAEAAPAPAPAPAKKATAPKKTAGAKPAAKKAKPAARTAKPKAKKA